MFNLKINGKRSIANGNQQPELPELSDEQIEKATGGASFTAIRPYSTLSYSVSGNAFAWSWGGGSILANVAGY